MKERFVLSDVPVGELLAEVLERFADLVAERLGAGAFVDQRDSPLGRNRHCAAVRRRMAEAKPGASKIGRRYLLSREAMMEELRGSLHVDGAVHDFPGERTAKPEPPPGSHRGKLLAKLRRVR